MRIVSLSPSITELLFALGIDEEIVGVTRFCDFPEQAKLKPKMGGWVDVDFVKVRVAKPDIVFTSTVVQDNIASEGRAIGLNIEHSDPRTLDEVLESFIKIGKLVSKEAEAIAIVSKMRSELEVHKKNKIKVYVEEWPMMVSGNWVPDVIELAGGISLCKSGELSHKITTEAVKKFDPDIIVVSWCGVSTRVPKETITEREGWKELRAVKNDKIFIIDDSLLNRPGPRLVDGAKLLSELIQLP